MTCPEGSTQDAEIFLRPAGFPWSSSTCAAAALLKLRMRGGTRVGRSLARMDLGSDSRGCGREGGATPWSKSHRHRVPKTGPSLGSSPLCLEEQPPPFFLSQKKKPISIRFLQLGPVLHGVTVFSLVCAVTW